MGSSVFSNCSALAAITLPSSVTTINSAAFRQMTALTSFTWPSTVTIINQQMFENCTNLNSITIPSTVTLIYQKTFNNCTSLTSVIVPDLVTLIDAEVFNNCSALTSVTIGAAVTTIGSSNFQQSPLTTVVMKTGSVVFSTVFSGINTITTVTFDYSGIVPANACVSRTSLTSVTISNTITSIGQSAFSGCTFVTTIAIPDTVTTIGDSAFADATNLAAVTLGSNLVTIGDSAFRNISLTTITIPASLTTIGSNAFQNTDLTQVLFTGVSQLTTLASYVFADCSNLTSFAIPASTLSIESFAFTNSGITSISIPNSVTTIGDSAFKGSTSLTQITVGTGLVFGNIGENVCESCTALVTVTLNSQVPASFFNLVTSITSATFDYTGAILANTCLGWTLLTSGLTIGTSITSIGENAFKSSGLTTVSIPNSVTTIGASAFESATSLATITLGISVSSIGTSAFKNAPFTTVTIPPSVTTIGSYAFQNTGLSNISFTGVSTISTINSYTFESCSALQSFSIPDSVTTISQFAFANSGIITITIPNTVTTIAASAFQNAVLTSITLGTGVTVIAANTFKNTGLTSITIPNIITTLGESSFEDTSSLTTVTFNAVSQLMSIGTNAFKNSALTALTLPDSVTTIGNYAFQNLTSLSLITIGSGLASIGTDAFAGNTSLTTFSVNANNATYSSDSNGVLYNKAETTLIQYPQAKPEATYRITYGVINVSPLAFASTVSLITIYLPFTLVTIGTNAFLNSALTTVYILTANSVVPTLISPSTTAPFYGVSTVNVIVYVPPTFYISACNVSGTCSTDATFSGYIESQPTSSNPLKDFTETNGSRGSITVADLKTAFKIFTTVNVSSDLQDSTNLVSGVAKSGGGFAKPSTGWGLGEVTYTEELSKAVFGSDRSADFFTNLATIKTSYNTSMDNNLSTLNANTSADASLSMFNAMLFYAPERFAMKYNATVTGAGAGNNVFSGIPATQTSGGAGAIVEISTSAATTITCITITTIATTPYTANTPITFTNGAGMTATITIANPIQLSYINGTLYNAAGTSLPFEPYDYVRVLFTLNHSPTQVNAARQVIAAGTNPYSAMIEFMAI